MVSPNYWKTLVPNHLLHLPGLESRIKAIMRHSSIQLDIQACNILASKVLGHAHSVIKGLPGHCRFKCGLTVDPIHRWENPSYGHKQEASWAAMRIVGLLAHGEAAAFLEAALVSSWAHCSQCMNRAGGGEAVSQQPGPFFVYVVVSAAAEG